LRATNAANFFKAYSNDTFELKTQRVGDERNVWWMTLEEMQMENSASINLLYLHFVTEKVISHVFFVLLADVQKFVEVFYKSHSLKCIRVKRDSSKYSKSKTIA
jgi:hypothetical protein